MSITSGRLCQRSSHNRSQFINQILSQAKKNQLLKELDDAYTELAKDAEYQAEIKLWDVTVGDGIDAEGWINCGRIKSITLVLSHQPPSNKFGANGKSPLKWTA